MASKFLELTLHLLLAAGVAACGPSPSGATGANTTPSAEACDPLAPSPVTVGRILGIGKDAAGALYVGEQHALGEGQLTQYSRVFVSTGDSLRRMSVTGSGQRGGWPDADFNLSFESLDMTRARTLLLHVEGGAATVMALGPAGSRVFISDSAAGTEPLQLLDASSIANWTIENLPRIVVDLFELDNGTRVVLTGDRNETEDVRLFFGPADRLTERTVTQWGRGHGGPDALTSIEFLVDGAPTSLLSYGGTSGVTTLTIGGASAVSGTHVAPPPAALPSASFFCLASAQ